MINLAIEGRPAVVVGGGEIASRKIEDLLAAKAKVTAIAPDVCARIAALADEKRIGLRLRPYRTGDLEGAFVVVASTGDEALNARIAGDAMERGALVNVVDRPALCTFTVPATVSRGDLTLAVATDGRCPALSSVLREELEGRYGPEYAGLVDLFAGLRSQMIAMAWEGPRIREALAGIYRDGVLALIGAGDREPFYDLLRARLGETFPLPE